MSAPDGPPSPIEALRRLDTLRAALSEARRSCEAGHPPALEALAQALDEALAGLPSLDGGARERLGTAFLDLLDETNRLAGIVSTMHQELRAKIIELNRHQRAGQTYGRSLAEGGFR